MKKFEQELLRRLESLRSQNLYRELRRVDSPQGARVRIAGQTLLNFSSNDYLGLANEPSLKAAARAAIDEFGVGAGASRLICGSLAPCHALEDALCEFKRTAAALSFSTGYATALGTIGALLEKDDVIIIDKLVHASIVDAARLCGAKLRVFAHNDLNELADLLKWADTRKGSGASGIRRPHVLVVTESIFSMDGDAAPLQEMVELKDRHGAWLMVDEAHATGLYGNKRRGLAEATGVGDRIEIQMGTLGKALGAAGGYVCGARALVDLLVNRARSFVFSTAPVPAAAAAASTGIQLVASDEGERRCAKLWSLVAELRRGLSQLGWKLPNNNSAIIPLIVGESSNALAMAQHLRESGIFIPAIRYPTVARDQARLRLTVTAAHEAGDLSFLISSLASMPAPPPAVTP